jgi:ubiquinone/menaquinone biosynthesis C-methylase UbiE
MSKPAHRTRIRWQGFPGAMFDTVVCTFSLCAIPDDRTAVAEMARVLHPGRPAAAR